MSATNQVDIKDDVTRAVFMAPWKTPSQYSAYVNTVQKALCVKDYRVAKQHERRALQSDKESTDQRVREMREVQRKAILRKQQESGRLVAAEVHRRAATPTIGSHRTAKDRALHVSSSIRCNSALDVRVPSALSAPLRATWKAPTEHAVEPSSFTRDGAPRRTPHAASLPPLPERNDDVDDACRVKLAAKDGHYIFQDEVGLIDIDDGESTDDSGADNEEFELAADVDGGSGAQSHPSKPVEDGVVVPVPMTEDTGTQALAHLLLNDETILRFMADVDEETEEILRAMRGDDDTVPPRCNDEDLDWVPHHQGHSPCATGGQAGGASRKKNRRSLGPAGSCIASHNRSIAVYLSSLRPNGLRAIVDIEASRRAQLERRWLEQWDTVAGNFTRQLAARRMKDNSTQRNANVIVEQEAALRISLVARCSASLDRLKRDEQLMCRKIARMARFRGRLNEREDAYAKDDERQKELLEQLAHKMLERVMRQDTDDDVLVDNTDPWAGGADGKRRKSSVGEKGARRLSTALRTSVVLHNFYGNHQRRKTLRRPSATPLGLVPEEGLLTSGGSGFLGGSGGHVSVSRGNASGEAHVSPMLVSFDAVNDTAAGARQRRPSALPSPPGARQRQMSLWAAPESRGDVSPGPKSIAFPSDSQTSSLRDHELKPPVDEAAEAATKRALRNQAKEERWKRDAHEIASGLKRELLHDRRPDFAKTYHERLQNFEDAQLAKANATPATAVHNASPAESVFGNFRAFQYQSTDNPFRLGSPSEQPTGSPTKTPPPPSAVLCARDFDISDSEDEDNEANDLDPVAAALRQRQRSAQEKQDARLAEYKQATSRHDLNQAVDAMIAGRVRRQTTFQQMAGMPTKHDKLRRPVTSTRAAGRSQTPTQGMRSPGGYLVDKQPEHTDFDVTVAAAELMSLSSKVDFLIAATGGEAERAKGTSGHSAHSHSHNRRNEAIEPKLLRRESLARLKSSAKLDSSRASFADFEIPAESEKEPPPLGALGRRPSSFFHLKAAGGSDGFDRSGGDSRGGAGGAQQGDLTPSSSSLVVPPSAVRSSLRGKRGNVASLLVTSGMGRHDVAQTRIMGDGDTLLYSKQRGGGGSPSLHHVPQQQHEAGSPLADSRAGNEDLKSQRQFSWSHTTRSDDGKSKSKAVQFVRDGAAPNIEHSVASAGNSSPVFEGVPLASCGSFQWGSVGRGGLGVAIMDPGTNSLHRATTVLADSNRPKRALHLAERTPDSWCLDASDFSL